MVAFASYQKVKVKKERNWIAPKTIGTTHSISKIKFKRNPIRLLVPNSMTDQTMWLKSGSIIRTRSTIQINKEKDHTHLVPDNARIKKIEKNHKESLRASIYWPRDSQSHVIWDGKRIKSHQTLCIHLATKIGSRQKNVILSR